MEVCLDSKAECKRFRMLSVIVDWKIWGMKEMLTHGLESRWEWADPDLALDLTLWPQGHYMKP